MRLSDRLQVVAQCQKELLKFPLSIRCELADVLARLNEGHRLSMPLSRPMPSIGQGVHELRFKDRCGIFRIIYMLKGADKIYLLHAFAKKKQKTPLRHINLAKQRIRNLL